MRVNCSLSMILSVVGLVLAQGSTPLSVQPNALQNVKLLCGIEEYC